MRDTLWVPVMLGCLALGSFLLIILKRSLPGFIRALYLIVMLLSLGGLYAAASSSEEFTRVRAAFAGCEKSLSESLSPGLKSLPVPKALRKPSETRKGFTLDCEIKDTPLRFKTETGYDIEICNNLEHFAKGTFGAAFMCRFARDKDDWKPCVLKLNNSREMTSKDHISWFKTKFGLIPEDTPEKEISGLKQASGLPHVVQYVGAVNISGINKVCQMKNSGCREIPLTDFYVATGVVSEFIHGLRMGDYLLSRVFWGTDSQEELCPEEAQLGRIYCVRRRFACLYEQVYVIAIDLADRGLDHQDIHFGNLMVDEARTFVDSDGQQCPWLVVIDFGTSKAIDKRIPHLVRQVRDYFSRTLGKHRPAVTAQFFNKDGNPLKDATTKLVEGLLEAAAA